MSRTPFRCFRKLAAASLALALVAVAGCRPQGGSAGAPGEMVLRVPQAENPTRWDPAAVQDGPTIEVLMHVVEGLVQWSPENRLVPCLANLPEVSRDGRTYTFRLKEGVKFHNGRTVTAGDFVYSINRSLDPATRSEVAATYLNDIVGAMDVIQGRAKEAAGVRAPDDRTLVIEIDRPKPYFLAKLTYPTAYVVAREGVEKGGGAITAPEHLIGTGPYTVAEYVREDHVTLVANPGYHEGRPTLDRVYRRVMTNAETRRQMFDAGELDLVDVPTADYERDRSDPDLRSNLRVFPRASVYYFAFNQKYAPFRDPRVRQAFTLAIDRDRIVREALLGVPPRAYGILPVGVPGHDPAYRGLPFDPERARALLAQAGYPGGAGLPPLTLSFRKGLPDVQRVCEVAESDLSRNLGVRVQLNQMEYGELLRQRNQDSLPFYFLRWAADYLDPQNFLSVMLRTGTPENRIGYSNAEFDRLCDTADAEQDPEKRVALYRRAERIAVEDAAWAPVFFQTDIELWRPGLRGIENGVMGRLPLKKVELPASP